MFVSKYPQLDKLNTPAWLSQLLYLSYTVIEFEYAIYPATCNGQYVYCVSRKHLKHIPRGESVIYEIEIVSTKVEVFREKINTVFCLFIANLLP